MLKEQRNNFLAVVNVSRNNEVKVWLFGQTFFILQTLNINGCCNCFCRCLLC